MIEMLFGIFLGFFLKPLLWYVCVVLLKSKLNPPYVRETRAGSDDPITATQVRLCIESLHQCDDVYWLNVVIQRYLMLAVQSYAFMERIRMMILKKALPFVQYKLIRKMEISKIDLGKEFPIVRSIKLLTQSELDDILLSSRDVREETDDDLSKMRANPEHTAPEDNEARKSDESRDVYGKIFKSCMLLVDTHFVGEMKVQVSIEVPGNIKYEINVVLEKFEGKALIRIPSRSHHTRLEMAFVSNPNFEISIKSLHNTDEDTLKNLSLKYIKKMFVYGLTNSVVYPSWNSFYLPLVCTSLRDIEHKTVKITVKNYEEVAGNIRHRILLYTSMDYKIIKKSFKYLKRRIQYFINGQDRIFRYEFPLPKNVARGEMGDESSSEIDTPVGAALSNFYTWSIFRDVFAGFIGMKCVKSFTPSVSLVLVYFSEDSYQFVRIKGDNFVIFQSNDENCPEFMLFQVKNDVFYIYQYGLRKNLMISDGRAAEIIKKMDSEKSKTLGSEKLHNILSQTFARANDYFKTSLVCPEFDANIGIETSLDEIYKTFLSYESMLNEAPEQFQIKEMNTNVSKIDMMAILLDDLCRFQLVGQNFEVIGHSKLNDFIYTSILAETSDKKGDMIIHTFSDGSVIIDAEACNNEFLQGVKVEERDEDVTQIKIFSRKSHSQINFMGFLNHLNLLIRHNEVRGMVEETLPEHIDCEETYERTLSCTMGAIYVELDIELGSCVSFSVSRNIRQSYMIKKIAICSEKDNRFIFSTEEKDRLLISLKSKPGSKSHVTIKIVQLSPKFYRDELVSCEVELQARKELALPISGGKSSSLFWKTPNDISISMELKCDDESLMLRIPGIIPGKLSRQVFLFTNLGDVPKSFKIHLGMANLC